MRDRRKHMRVVNGMMYGLPGRVEHLKMLLWRALGLSITSVIGCLGEIKIMDGGHCSFVPAA